MPFPYSLESYDACRADFERVLEAVREIRRATNAQLHDVEWLAAVVRSVGLSPLFPPEEIYANEAAEMNGSQQGITQMPREFARWLILLSGQRVHSYLEVGCAHGGTAVLAAAYLQRFEPELRVITIDVWPWFYFYPLVRDLVPLEYRVGDTSFSLRDQSFDAVFIDGDHSFEWARADYENVGRCARICGIHDIASQHFYEAQINGGVTGAWQWIRRDEAGPGIRFEEFVEHPTRNHFGIGVRLREDTGDDS